ncbi:MAG: SDR family oxidoreductase, partial [Ktedonobacterales bacterium]|nr:SDR family oxidoreductase [Ktedonobacterales bacterium]
MQQTLPSTALITGASRGLGLALARALAQRGWRLLVDARDAAPLMHVRDELSRATQVSALVGDIADPAHRRALAQAAQDLGELALVVNNASILGASPLPPLLDYPLDTLHEVFMVNTIAPLALLQALRPTLATTARILNITSDAALEAYPGWG